MQNKTIKLLLYCTKAKPYLVDTAGVCSSRFVLFGNEKDILERYYGIEAGKKFGLNGKVVAECDCDLVEKEEYSYLSDEYSTFDDDRLENTCLSRMQLNEYGKYKPLYLIHLKNVKPLDEQIKLNYYGLDKAPQNMCNVWLNGQKYILISIRQKWLCKILNGEKTIEIRKSIINSLKELIANE